MGIRNTFIYVNLDAHEQGIRYCARIAEDKLDPHRTLLRRLYDPKIIRKLPFSKTLLPPCSTEQRHHLGQLDIAPELWSLILSYLTDLTSAACFGAAHPLLTHCALERMRDIQMSVEGVSAWAGHRVALVNETFCHRLPRDVYTASEWAEWDPKNTGYDNFLEWNDAEGYNEHPTHGDEWSRRGGVGYGSSKDKDATRRWEIRDLELHGYRSSRKKAKDVDYTRVWLYLEHVENVEMWCFQYQDGDHNYVLCNESKREYVLARSVAEFNGGLNRWLEPDLPECSWTLGDTAGFLVCWDVGAECGRGEGPWAGDRVSITTMNIMEVMEGSGEWRDIGTDESDLWQGIDAFLKMFFSYDGKSWKENYDRAGYYDPFRLYGPTLLGLH